RRELVVPRLLLPVPEHPPVAEVAEERGEDPRELPAERAQVAEPAAGREIDHADAEQLLPDRLARGASLEVREVGVPDQDRDVHEWPADRVEDAADDGERDQVDDPGAEPLPKVRPRPGRPGPGGGLIGG